MTWLLTLSFFIWPFGTLLLSLNGKLIYWSKNIVWLFVIYYGYTFVLSNELLDANRTYLKFLSIAGSNMSLGDVIKTYYLDNEEGVDIIQPIIFYFISAITKEFSGMMAILGLIFGFFYSRNLDYLIKNSNGKIKSYNFILITLFLLVIGFWEINRFRFFTSAVIYFYAIIPFVLDSNKNRLWLVPIICLFHFTFIFPTVILLIFIILRKKTKLYFFGFLISFILVSLNVTSIGELLVNFLPTNLHNKIIGYTNEDYLAQQAENIISISYIMRYLMYLLINTYFFVFYFFYKKEIEKDKLLSNYFPFVLLFMAASNFISIIPSGDRFLALSAMFSISFIFFFFQKYELQKKHLILKYFSVPIFLISAFGFLRLSFDTMDLITLIGNPIVAFFDHQRISLIELIQ